MQYVAYQSTTNLVYCLEKVCRLYLKHLDVLDFEKKKRAEERAKESQKATEENYEDYAWKDLCENLTKLKKF